jgi:hypothetical protein
MVSDETIKNKYARVLCMLGDHEVVNDAALFVEQDREGGGVGGEGGERGGGEPFEEGGGGGPVEAGAHG